MSHGAKALYVALKRRVPKNRNKAFISFRDAKHELRSSQRKIYEWFKELKHYGFIVLVTPGCLGVDGKGKAPHWRLTEAGQTRQTSATGIWEPPTNDFLKWDGSPFQKPERKDRKQKPVSLGGYAVYPGGDTPVLPTWDTPNVASASHGIGIQRAPSVSHGVGVTSLPLSRATTVPPLPQCSKPERLHHISANVTPKAASASARRRRASEHGLVGKLNQKRND
jgi:hypothetical protein